MEHLRPGLFERTVGIGICAQGLSNARMDIKMETKKTCSICEEEFSGFGNNPEPFAGDRCCDECNDRFVIPTRMVFGRNAERSVSRVLTRIVQIGRVVAATRMESARRERVKEQVERLMADGMSNVTPLGKKVA
jgi:hypothetical protein